MTPGFAFVILGLVTTIQGYQYAPTPNESAALEEYKHTARSLIESANVMRCLARKYLTTCDSLSQLYYVLELEVYENRKFFESHRSRDEAANFLGLSIRRSLEGLQDVNSKCVGQVAYDCNRPNSHDAWTAIIPQELTVLIASSNEAGSLLLHLLESHPSKQVIYAMESIMEKAVLLVNSDKNGATTSVGRFLVSTRTAAENIRKLEQILANYP